MLSPEARKIIGGILVSTLYSGCQIISPDQRVTPTTLPLTPPTPELVPTRIPATPTPTLGERYDKFRTRLNDLPLFYRSLIGSDVFESKEDFLTGNRGQSLPQSVAFTWGDGLKSQITYGPGFLLNDIMFFDTGEATTRYALCAPGSKSKKAIYGGLVEEFEHGAEVDKKLLEALMAGMAPDCTYFIDLETGQAPRNPRDVQLPKS